MSNQSHLSTLSLETRSVTRRKNSGNSETINTVLIKKSKRKNSEVSLAASDINVNKKKKK
jgi:hypothetical protein